MSAPLQCICGHYEAEHPDDGPCAEPTGRCQCPEYLELCPKCQHSKAVHDGPHMGECTRVVFKTRMPCGCTHYPPPGS